MNATLAEIEAAEAVMMKIAKESTKGTEPFSLTALVRRMATGGLNAAYRVRERVDRDDARRGVPNGRIS